MGFVDARNGIFDTHLAISCSHIPTKGAECTFSDEITEGWGFYTPNGIPAMLETKHELLKMLSGLKFFPLLFLALEN